MRKIRRSLLKLVTVCPTLFFAAHLLAAAPVGTGSHPTPPADKPGPATPHGLSEPDRTSPGNQGLPQGDKVTPDVTLPVNKEVDVLPPVPKEGEASIPVISDEEIAQEAARMRDEVPLPTCMWDFDGWRSYDSIFYVDQTKKIKVWGHVMDRGELNYYYIGMACRLKKMAWVECEAIIRGYKLYQRVAGFGTGKVTPEILMAAAWGYSDEQRRDPQPGELLLPPPPRPVHQPTVDELEKAFGRK